MKVEEKKWARSNGLSASASAPAPADVRGHGATEGSETAIEATSDAPRRGRLILRAAIYAVFGFLMVIFCFWGVNFLLSGLHAYA